MTNLEYRINLLLENGLRREIITYENTMPVPLILSVVQAEEFMRVIGEKDVDWIHETGVDDVTAPWGPQLALSENKGVKFWITGDPNNNGKFLKVVAVDLVPFTREKDESADVAAGEGSSTVVNGDSKS